jgi:Tol biopolymer transport system component
VTSLDTLATIMSTAWSRDGTEIAFTATLKAGGSKLYVVSASGGEPRAAGRETPSGDMAWAPGRHIIYQVDGSRNFSVLDPVSGTEGRLFQTEEGWAFSPASSPNGERVALMRNLYDGTRVGLWTVSLADGSRRFEAANMGPIGYSPDGRTLYAFMWAQPIRDLYEVPTSGEPPSPLGALPFEQTVRDVALVPGTRSFACLVAEAESDLWLVEGFDPEATAR